MESSETTQVEKFQSPQWGSNSKVVCTLRLVAWVPRFSPRNGEVILKFLATKNILAHLQGFSPRNGEVILKGYI